MQVNKFCQDLLQNIYNNTGMVLENRMLTRKLETKGFSFKLMKISIQNTKT